MNETEPALPTETSGTEITRFNALRHGVLSRYTVLPWEDADEYHALVTALVAEHGPQGPTEEHLVEELAGILWRKRRLRLAEAAAYRRGLKGALAPYRDTAEAAVVHLEEGTERERTGDAIRATASQTEVELADIEEDEALTRRALYLLNSQRNDAYQAALGTLREDTQEWWAEMLARRPDEPEDDEAPCTADVECLRRFIETEVLPQLGGRRRELANRPLIRDQAFGESLDPEKLERLGRYEVHLDRKLERMLAILLRIKDLRQERIAG